MERKQGYDFNKPNTQPQIYLKEWRMVHGLSQTEIAERMGASKSEVSRLEASKRKANVGWLERYSSALGISREQLFSPPGVTMVRREEVVSMGGSSKTGTAVGPLGLSANPPLMFVMASDAQYLLIDMSKGQVVGKLEMR